MIKQTLTDLKQTTAAILKIALEEHLKTSSLKTLDCANASTKTTDFYIKQEKQNEKL